MLLYLFILCMFYILTLLIGMGDGKQFPKPQSEIRFGWGLSYNYIGQVQHNLDKYDVVVGLEIPDFRTVSYYAPSPLIHIIVKGGMMHSLQTMKSYMKLALRFGQLT